MISRQKVASVKCGMCGWEGRLVQVISDSVPEEDIQKWREDTQGLCPACHSWGNVIDGKLAPSFQQPVIV